MILCVVGYTLVTAKWPTVFVRIDARKVVTIVSQLNDRKHFLKLNGLLHLVSESKQLFHFKILVMKDSSKILIALGAGLVAGGVLGILFAPDKGKNTRNKIAEGGKKIKEQIASKVKFGKEKMEDVMSRVNGELEEVM